ncbi:MAG TPA: diacylglycerol kinase family protein [Flavisolibacter sp.]|nr:diacylglycerol kinase family protein [Flavisolibacter sp.]
MDERKHIALVCNPTRENQKALRMTSQIASLLESRQVRYSIYAESWPMSWRDTTEVWIIGGDGTLNCFINQYPDISLPLGIFAGGSGNDFHWMLYGNIGLEAQVDKYLDARVKQVDAGVCNGRIFLNGVGIGFDGAIVRDLLGKRKLAGKASYLLSILKHIMTYHEKPCTLLMKDEIWEQDCFMVSMANGSRYGGGFMVAPEASVTDGLLDLNVVGKISPINRMRYLPVIEKGEHLGLPFIRYQQEASLVLSAPLNLHCHVDGEYMYASRFEIEVLPARFSFLYYDPSFSHK